MYQGTVFQYSENEEIANWLSHGIGILFGIFVLISLMLNLPVGASFRIVASYIIYSVSLITLFSASTAYHFAKKEKYKIILKKMDHICIFFLIAGSYTPFLLVSIGGSFGTKFCIMIWAIALLGSLFKFFHIQKFKKASVLIYIGMGTLMFFVWDPMCASVSVKGREFILFGGFFYIFGTIFYVMKKLNYHHMIWHIFVLLGSFCHFRAVQTLLH